MAGEEDEPEAIGLRKRGLFDLAVEEDELLTEQRIFGDEVGVATGQVCDGAENNRVAGRLDEVQEDWFKERNETNAQLNKPIQEGEHVVGLRESCQTLSEDCTRCAMGVNLRSDGVFSQHRQITMHNTQYLLPSIRHSGVGLPVGSLLGF